MTIIFTVEDMEEIAFPTPITMVKVATPETPVDMYFDGQWITDNGEW
jgi:hypothetical protein